MPRRRAALVLLLAVVAVATAGRSGAQPAQAPEPEVTITEHLGQTVTLDTPFLNSDGEAVQVGDYLGQGRPVVLVFTYHSCPMLCSLILDVLAQTLVETDLVAGEDFEVLTVSFDPRDTPERAAEVKARYVAAVQDGQPTIADDWHFLVGDAEASQRLARQVGFGYEFVDETGEYAHNAALILLSPEGTITRYLYGISYPPRDFRLAMVEAGDGTVGTTLDRFLLTCFQYDATTRTYTPYIRGIMKLGGVLLLIALAAVLVPLWRRERRRQRDPNVLGVLPDLTD